MINCNGEGSITFNFIDEKVTIKKSSFTQIGRLKFLNIEVKNNQWHYKKACCILDDNGCEIFPVYMEVDDIIYLNQEYFATVKWDILKIWKIDRNINIEYPKDGRRLATLRAKSIFTRSVSRNFKYHITTSKPKGELRDAEYFTFDIEYEPTVGKKHFSTIIFELYNESIHEFEHVNLKKNMNIEDYLNDTPKEKIEQIRMKIFALESDYSIKRSKTEVLKKEKQCLEYKSDKISETIEINKLNLELITKNINNKLIIRILTAIISIGYLLLTLALAGPSLIFLSAILSIISIGNFVYFKYYSKEYKSLVKKMINLKESITKLVQEHHECQTEIDDVSISKSELTQQRSRISDEINKLNQEIVRLRFVPEEIITIDEIETKFAKQKELIRN